ncbi:MAG: hypothetical protein ABEI86_08945 [Halobacteriaceae archaeon]
MGSDVLVVGGRFSGRSTFFGGLLHYCEKQAPYTVQSKVVVPGRDLGSKKYNDISVYKMLVENMYPDVYTEGHIYTLKIQSHGMLSDEVSLRKIGIPGHRQSLLDPRTRKPLLARIRDGQVDSEDTVRERFIYELQPYDDLDLPLGRSEWETIFLYHWYTSDKVLFLLNLHKILDVPERQLALSTEAIDQARSDFSRVAVIPTAVDRLGYDPNSFDRGRFETVVASLRGRRYRDPELLAFLDQNLSGGVIPAREILHAVATNSAVDCFSIAVPDKGSPETQTGDLTPDGSGGFVVQGFDTLSSWLMECEYRFGSLGG